MNTFTPFDLKRASISEIRNTLTDGLALLKVDSFRIAIADSLKFRIDVVRRTEEMKFSEIVSRLPANHRVVVNGNYFDGPTGLYLAAHAGNVFSPEEITSVGDVIQGGKVVLKDNGGGPMYFYFGRTGDSPPNYLSGFGNPTLDIENGMGGLGPLIQKRPFTGQPIKFGAGNFYRSNSEKHAAPSNLEEWKDCIQRNNNTYERVNRESIESLTGFCVVASHSHHKLLALAIKPHRNEGSLDQLRDLLFEIGFDLAAFTDGSTSTCMAVDRNFEFPPADFKDNLIATGFALVNHSLPRVTLQIHALRLVIIDDSSWFGAGEWTLIAEVNGILLGELKSMRVEDQQVVQLNWVTEVSLEPSLGDTLKIRVYGFDVQGLTDTFDPILLEFNQTSTPPWGCGEHKVVNASSHYSIEFRIKVVG